jgi:glycine reductase
MCVLAGKERAASMNAALAESLGATGVIITEEGTAIPTTDLCLNAKQMEPRGIRTVIIADEGGGQRTARARGLRIPPRR